MFTTARRGQALAAAAIAMVSWRMASQSRRKYRWLEQVLAEPCLDWVRGRNKNAVHTLGHPEGTDTYKRILDILDSNDKIPYASKYGNHLYNFWQDDKHVRGIWRRTSMEEYEKADTQWETVLDLDALSKEEDENWVYKGYNTLDLPGEKKDRVIFYLSRGGADATVCREFDVTNNKFVDPKDGGFYLPEAKTRLSWRTRNLLYVGTDTGEGSLTASGYPRTVREWTRGTQLKESKLIFEGKASDISASQHFCVDKGHAYNWRTRQITFYTAAFELERGGRWVKLAIPGDMEVSSFAGCLLFNPRSDWEYKNTTYKQGSLVSIPVDDFFEGTGTPQVLFIPTPRSSLSGWSETKNFMILSILENVRSVQHFWEYTDGKWIDRETNKENGLNTVSTWALDSEDSDDYWMSVSGFIQPSTLRLCKPLTPAPAPMKALPTMYNAEGLVVQQHEAVSKDGTLVPYFMISRSAMTLDGNNPTLLYGYGGFEISLTPAYQATTGVGWLEEGFVYVTANIRGGGEFGPAWHQAALKEKRHKAYEDFEAVAEDLIKRGVTSPKRLGIQGGSNGGLLMGNMLVRRPDLFGAIVCSVPLLDMKRYTKLLAGASWAGEFGDPDKPEDWSYLRHNSPLHCIDPAKVASYPSILFTTSTRDDRVHPAHARKMAMKLMDLGAPDVVYYENIEGGHGGASNAPQRAFMSTLTYSYLKKKLCANL